ncbi:MAG TPA: ferric reductase-like transmembrane domain-containing protein [Patescibacteria group bacterium]|nr:ferric reductase-like transmembrane domain-containing protein [Patescibacteria group bacterium]
MTSTPSPFWYIDRSAGEVTILLLSAVVILGIMRSAIPSALPFVVEGIHRRLALLAIAFGGLHVIASLLDPYANLGPLDAMVPFASAYRATWLGLGVVSAYIYVAVVLSSWPVRRLSRVWWRWLHRTTYIAWAVALIHTLGTGTDARNNVFLLLNIAAVAGVLAVFLGYRIYDESQPVTPLRALAGIAGLLAVAGIAFWAFNGPMQPGWARVSGTPPGLLRSH